MLKTSAPGRNSHPHYEKNFGISAPYAESAEYYLLDNKSFISYIEVALALHS